MLLSKPKRTHTQTTFMDEKMGKKTCKAEQKKKKQELKAQKPQQPPLEEISYDYPKRPLLSIPRKHEDVLEGEFKYEGLPLSIMTFNMLAQSLIQRKLFPTSGDILKWNIRKHYITTELFHYNADILCLQEVDIDQYRKFWEKEFAVHGYSSEFVYASIKRHGVVIAWKTSVFEEKYIAKRDLDYDLSETDGLLKVTKTGNIACLLKLQFQKEYKLKHAPNSKTNSICIGNTHLFWHPFGTFERTRQTFIMLREMQKFALETRTEDDVTDPVVFFCGDFNSQPFDTPYLSITCKPVDYNSDKRMQTVLNCSLSYNYKEEKNPEYDNPSTPVPLELQLNPDHQKLCSQLQDLHNNLDYAATSLYSVGYKYVHPENSGLDNDRCEPEISNWAHQWKGLLDYILLLKKWQPGSDMTKIPTLEDFENDNRVKIKSFLRLPPASELPDHGIPHPHEYGSDHLSLMCELYIQ